VIDWNERKGELVSNMRNQKNCHAEHPNLCLPCSIYRQQPPDLTRVERLLLFYAVFCFKIIAS
jgi:hypothetical protein